MFVNNYEPEILDQLKDCLRVMPHHQNTSGFFITVIEKLAEVGEDKPILAEEDISLEKIQASLKGKELHNSLTIQKDSRNGDF